MNPLRILAITVAINVASLSAQTGGTPWTTPALAEVDAIYPDIDALYIDLHRNPELAFQETQTAAKLASRVKALGFDVTTGVGRTGIVAVMKNGPGPTVMLRTELDALPVEEDDRSAVCEHRGDQERQRAIDAGDARVRARSPHVRVGRHGASDGRAPRPLARHARHGGPACRRGRRRRSRDAEGRSLHAFPRPDFALSLHDDDTMPAGTIGYHPGYFRAMSDAMTLTVYGRGGHAAMPYNTIDPIVLAARIVLALADRGVAREQSDRSGGRDASGRSTVARRPTSSRAKCGFNCRSAPTRPR